MTPELTTADDFTLESATKEDHDYDYTSDLDVTLNRWSKDSHDRLYVNGLNWDCYVDLSDGSVHVDGGAKLTPVGTDLDGDELTITVAYGRKVNPDKTVEITVTVHGDAFEAADEDDEDAQKIACDGGDDTTAQFTDDEIVEAIEEHDDPDHLEATTVAEARTLLAQLQSSFEDYWDNHLDAIDDDHMSVVYEDRDVLVLADHTGHGWTEERDALDLPDDVAGQVLKSIHHKAAGRLCEYSWTASDPFVVAKPDSWQRGEQHVERRVGQLARAADVTEAQAMDYYQVKIRGWTQSGWARLVGKKQPSVSEAISEVEGGLAGPELS